LPKVTDENWTKFVLDNLRDDEKVVEDDGTVYPRCVGLLRFCQEYYGDIMQLEPMPAQLPSPDNMRAVASAVIVIKRRSDDEVVTFSEIAEADIEQLSDDYKHHLAAIASTRAQSRAVKKAMFLNCYTNEEMMGSKKKGGRSKSKNDPNNSIRMLTINTLVDKLRLDKEELLSKFKIRSWDSIPAKKQEQIIEYLNEVELRSS